MPKILDETFIIKQGYGNSIPLIKLKPIPVAQPILKLKKGVITNTLQLIIYSPYYFFPY
jgi:hypothetical protein